MSSGRLLIVRHGESEGNAQGRFTGSHHVPLTERGREQARRVGEFLRHLYAPLHLVSSPYARALETALLIAQPLELPVEIVAEVREQHLGDLHGKPYEAAAKTEGFDDLARHEWRPPNGETLLEVQARAVPALRIIAREHATHDVVVVSHAGTIASVWAHTLGGWDALERVPNTAILVVAHSGDDLEQAELIAPDED